MPVDEAVIDARPDRAEGGIFSVSLARQPADGLLALIGLYAADPRPGKIDLGVGVYKDEAGRTPVFTAVKAAERQLLDTQVTKAYVGPEGDKDYTRLLAPISLGDKLARSPRLSAVQTPGGTGALRLGLDLLALAKKGRKIHVGMPTWANHLPLIRAAGLEIVGHDYIDLGSQEILFDGVMAALRKAEPGDAVLLQAACHNPIGADFSLDQWEQVAAAMAERGLIPFVDCAYQGLGDGLEEDAQGLRIVAEKCPELLVAYSCDKNFGLYRERVGALYVLSGDEERAQVTLSNMLSLARANWSMPPDHGAAIVRVILESRELTAQWRTELDAMRERIGQMRAELARLDPQLGFMARQKGMFSTLDLSPEQIKSLREDHAVYMAGSGRINIAGLVPDNVGAFVAALAKVRG